MSHSIHARIGHWSTNSLSPEPCVLSPNPLSLSFSSIVKAVEGPRRDDKRMGGYAAESRGVR